PEKQADKKESTANQLPIEKIRKSNYQPRIQFNEDSHKELVESVKKQGIIQPIIVRSAGDEFELVAGERRMRAAIDAGLSTIPVVIKDVSDKEAMELALIENIMREDLDPIEEAKGYYRLIKEFSLTQEAIAEEVGKERSSIANSLRLLKLPGNIRELISQGLVSVGHAKVLLGIPSERQMENICKQIVNKSLSVREVEKLIEKSGSHSTGKKKRSNKDPHLSAIEDELRRKFGTSVRIWQGTKYGKVTIEYYSKEDLGRILEELEVKIK
ncbi:ParB/RepB/Spo0J family partition protein, partial [Candidatus Auribacterota bacterium]